MHPLIDSYFKFIKQQILTSGDDGVIGIDLTPTTCRAVELRQKKSGFELVRWCVEPVDGTDEKGALARLLEKMGPSVRSIPVVVGVSGKGTLIRHIDMPRMTSADLKRSFPLEADKYFPFPKETVYTDCFILDPQGSDKKMPVLVAAVKKDIIDARMKLFKEFDIDPQAVTIASIAVANTFMAFPPPACSAADLGGKAVAMVDVGDTLTSLMIISDGMPRFTRDIFMGIADVTRRVANLTGLSLPQARALCLSNDSKEHAEDIQKSVEAVFANLVNELKVSFDYFSTEKKLPIGRVCLVGDGAHVQGAEAVFAANFNIPLVAWEPALMLPGGADREGFVKEGRRMTTAIGLALGEYDQA
jgi:type IV pilus assembly protein PilM